MLGFFKNLFSNSENSKEDAIKHGASIRGANTSNEVVDNLTSGYNKAESYTGNRRYMDSGKAKHEAKKNLFDSQAKVVDPYTGDTLVLTKKEAKMRYGENWTKHLAETDHVKPLERIYDDVQDSTFLKAWTSYDDIKDAANSSENLSVSSRKFNNAKRSRTNSEYVGNEAYLRDKGVKVTKSGKTQAILDGEIADIATTGRLYASAVGNMVETGHRAGMAGAQASSVDTITLSGICNIVDVARGKKNIGDAAVDVAVDTAKGAAASYVTAGGTAVLSRTLVSSSSTLLQTIGRSNLPGQVVATFVSAGGAMVRFANGEITGKQLAVEVSGAAAHTVIAGQFYAAGNVLTGSILGGMAGAMVGAVMVGSYVNGLLDKLNRYEIAQQERQRIIEECKAAEEMYRNYREELQRQIDEYLYEYRSCFTNALGDIEQGFKIGDIDSIVAGANQITQKLGGKVAYNTMDEYMTYFESDEVDVF